MEKKYSFYDLSFQYLKLFLIERIDVEEKKSSMRAKQIFYAIYRKRFNGQDNSIQWSSEIKRRKLKDGHWKEIDQ